MRIHTGFRRRALVAALSAIYSSTPLWVQANPTGAQVVHGQATLQTQGSKLTVTNTPGAIINWQSFSIGKGETTHFQQQNAASSVLNRVGMQNAAAISKIDGTLSSNGRVFLINPNGIVFGAGSVVDTQGLIASTLSLSDDDFKSGKLRFARQGAAGDLQAQGRISVGAGDVFLLAPNIGVDGAAVIQSNGGNVVLAAGEAIEITGRNLNDITFAVQNSGNEVLNLGNVSGGAVGLFAGTLRHSGVVQAQTLAREGGKLVLKASGNVTLGAGSVTAADGSSRGGDVSVVSSGGNVVVDQGSRVSADASTLTHPLQADPRGGNVQLQAAAGLLAVEQGASVQANAARGGVVSVSGERLLQSGAVRADGTQMGGQVVVHGEQRVLQTQSALVSATGGALGGSVRVSTDAAADGSGHLFSSATVDASASAGVGGQVVISGRELVLAGAQVRADGDAGGGSIRIGGGRTGTDASVPNAQNLTVSGSTQLSASARTDGDGGSVINWSDGVTKFSGTASARGGAQGGDGGFIEVSGKLQTQFVGVPDASAPNGQPGTFLLDPKFIVIQAPTLGSGQAVELLDPNPGTGDFFGSSLQSLLSDTRIVVINTLDDLGGTNAGAVYLFDGVSGALLSHLRGSSANDQIGSSGLSFLSGNTYVLRSPNWTNTVAPNSPANAGAMTWFDVSTGLTGVVSSGNSLVGNSAGDSVGSNGITNHGGSRFVLTPNWNSGAGALTRIDPLAPPVGSITASNSLVGIPGDQVGSNGFYNLNGGFSLLFSPQWNGGMGAVTWVNQSTGLTGTVDAMNSLVGSTPGDSVGSGFWQFLGSRMAIVSADWANGGANPSAGALTWASPSTPTVGPVSAANSLVGSQSNDRVGDYGSDGGGTYGLITLGFIGGSTKGVVRIPTWNGNAGAVTWIDSNAPVVGPVSSSNSLVGANPGDLVGGNGVRVLNNGNYVTLSPNAEIGGLTSAGAVTWSSGLGGPTTVGVVDASNSFVGTHVNDAVGSGTFIELFNGSFVVRSGSWNGGAGAVTWGNGTSQLIGSPDNVATTGGNSVYGLVSVSQIGNAGVRELGNGDFAVFSPNHSTGLIDIGAFTIGSVSSGFQGATGPVSSANSIVGNQAGDRVGLAPNSHFFDEFNYVLLRVPNYKGTAGATNAGAVIWSNGQPIGGDVASLSGSSANAIFGLTANDAVGANIEFLDSGNFVVRSPTWANTPSVPNAGAVTFGSAFNGFESDGRTAGAISSSNSLVGTSTGDRVGLNSLIEARSSDHYLILSPQFGGGAGAVTWADGFAAATGTIGASSNSNSIFGAAPGDGVGAGGVQFLDFYSGPCCEFGHFVVVSLNFGGGSGAITWGSANTGFVNPGVVSASNSLVGAPGDQLGSGGILRLEDPFNSSLSNYLILSPNYGGGAGAVTWADGQAAIMGTVGAETNGSSIFGSLASDSVGNGGITILNSYHFVVRSLNATNPVGGVTNAGGVTFGRYDTGFAGSAPIHPTNSLMGSTAGDRIGDQGIVPLFDNNDFLQSNYLILSPDYQAAGGTLSNAGAVTWASGSLPIFGEIGSETHGNSMVGGTTGDFLGNGGITQFNNGNFAVRSSSFTNGAAAGAGAITFGTQATGFSMPGVANASNSLVGSHVSDSLGNNGVSEIGGGKYAVYSGSWNSARGAVTWGDTTTGVSGVVDATNSLVGMATGDNVGTLTVSFMGSERYLRSAGWGGFKGALTYINLANLPVGVVDATNSLIGASANDQIGSGGIQSLSNGRFAVVSRFWDNGATVDAGAVTWLDATQPLFGLTGVVGAGNSLVGSTANDSIGSNSSTLLSPISGNLWALRSGSWDNGAATDAGAITWLNTAGVLPVGAVGAGNSLVGTNANDRVGGAQTGFHNGPGYFITRNGFWNGSRGSVTWMTAGSPLVGAVSSSNSLVGANPNEFIGNSILTSTNNGSFSLANGDYVVLSSSVSGGAVTVGSASGGISGVMSAANSQLGFGTGINFVNSRTRMRLVNTSATSQGFVNAGRVCLYSGGAGCPSSAALGSQLYGDNATGTSVITPSQILAILNAGTNVTLQASTDITLGSGSDIIANNPSGNGGTLTLQAGRSVLLNSSITTDNGNLFVYANDQVANGVQAANRDAGTAEITMANGTTIDAGSGSVVFQLRDGAGHSGSTTADGVITLRSITAANLSVETDFGGIQVGAPGASSASMIKLSGDAFFKAATTILFAGGGAGAPAELSADGQITIDPPTLEMRSGGSYARIFNPTQLFPLDIVVAECITCVFVSPYEITGISSSIPELVVGLLGASGGSGGGVDLDPLGKKQEEEIVVDTGESCQ